MKSYTGIVGFSLLVTAMTAIGLPASAAELKAKTAILVHGAFADGSSWEKVIPYLEKAGLKVIAVQNPLDSLDNGRNPGAAIAWRGSISSQRPVRRRAAAGAEPLAMAQDKL